MPLFACFGGLALKLTSPRIPEAFLKPQGLYQSERLDTRKLKRLILDGKLAPCFPGHEEPVPSSELNNIQPIVHKLLKRKGQQSGVEFAEVAPDTPLQLEECPICFLHYPLLNTSKCCGKRVCTECFLQVRTSPQPTLDLSERHLDAVLFSIWPSTGPDICTSQCTTELPLLQDSQLHGQGWFCFIAPSQLPDPGYIWCNPCQLVSNTYV